MLVDELQKQIRESQGIVALQYTKGNSNTTRSKSYKRGCKSLSCKGLDKVLHIDVNNKRVRVHPRVTMDTLVSATLAYGLIPPITPEFKGITIGGAIMGAAAESGSHQWGIFHDICTEVKLIDGRGDLITASPTQNSPLFYGISGSYGSLGMLVEAEIKLVSAYPTVLLRYDCFKDPQEALDRMKMLIGQTDFLDGILFGPNHGVIISGEMLAENPPHSSSHWFAGNAKNITSFYAQKMPLYDYLFRYDEGAFWMGSLLFKPNFLTRFFTQGILKWPVRQNYFSDKEIAYFKDFSYPNTLLRKLARPFMRSIKLWKLLHYAENWVQDRLVIQDCCIPTPQSNHFLKEILKDPGIYPIWLCPLKGTDSPQHFAPHIGHPTFINFGLYGIPTYSAPMEKIMKKLEAQTHACGGRKVLYSLSYYSEEDFWNIYPKQEYEQLRHLMQAERIWRGLTDKVLSN